MTPQLSLQHLPTASWRRPVREQRKNKKNWRLYACDETAASGFVSEAAPLRQVLLNLAGTAIKFTTKGGMADRRPLDRAPVKSASCCATAEFGVADDARARIFRKFEQGDEGGTHLRHHPEHGGKITLRSEPGRGSTRPAA